MEMASWAPQLRHGNIIRSQAFQGINILCIPGSTRLRMGSETMGMCKLSESSVVIGRYQLGDGPSVVPEKPRGNLARLDDLAGQTWKVAQGTVFSALFERL